MANTKNSATKKFHGMNIGEQPSQGSATPEVARLINRICGPFRSLFGTTKGQPYYEDITRNNKKPSRR